MQKNLQSKAGINISGKDLGELLYIISRARQDMVVTRAVKYQIMKKYLLDTCVFRKLLDHCPKKGVRFEAVWEQIDNGFEAGEWVSVDEGYNEL